MESVPHLCGVPPKTHNPSLLTRKTSGKPRVSVKCLANIPQDCMTNKEKLRNGKRHGVKRDGRDMVSRCSVVSWIGSWKRESTRVEILVKHKCSPEFS